ncbi:hypothetical protein EYZ11_011651 [Aspergillus tanneri]|uniref:Uncharacterized protein n=1 Tax=Aspergillus tanneri TaxID=1220188 RepID=A0A4S3J4D7_9EURO|nr:uncharacterized protein ATNIH1004_010508 [Aspergillus tanneri]KAA8643734.1 hypothetical protein ATNIH1004_010508 [Aspergillus tanneri]THC88907.1 hypothetical protein EYZ11_011651 [Aspergillus tanneri]
MPTQSHSGSQLRDALAGVHPNVQERFYGCGSPIPALVEGPRGRLAGVDASEEQMFVAWSVVDWHAQFVYANVESS